MANFIELTAADGHKFPAYEARPAGPAKGAIVVLQEITLCCGSGAMWRRQNA